MRQLLLLVVLGFGVSALTNAEDRVEHGDWASQFREGMGEASTHDNGKAMFGMLCANRVCRYYFANGTPCEPGNNYPMMLTTKAGAVALDSVCEPMETANGEVMLYWFSESAQLNDALSRSESVGFAFPLTSGHFRTNVFSMAGYNDAIGRMGLVPAEVTAIVREGDTKQTVLGVAEEVNADLIVMGGYGHTRFRQLMLGGVTRTLLHSMTVPVLMAH
jgi:hypothetical protein